MNELDRQISEILSVLAAIVNRAGRAESTSASEIKVSGVPTQLLYKALRALEWWVDSEYQTDEMRRARYRQLE